MHLLFAVLTIAAASDLQPVLPRLVAAFERDTGHTVRATFGSSGNFYAQIANGAPFDVFLSADVSYPRQLEKAGLTQPDTLVVYANGSIVLWSRTSSGVDIKAGLSALRQDTVRKIAIANPEYAPYGRAAVAALRAAGLYDRLRPNLVLGENVAQAVQFVQSGNADAGLIPLSHAKSDALRALGTYVIVPSSLYPPIEQAAVVIRSSKEQQAARAFVQYLQRPAAVAMLTQAGFTPVPAHASR